MTRNHAQRAAGGIASRSRAITTTPRHASHAEALEGFVGRQTTGPLADRRASAGSVRMGAGTRVRRE